MIDVHCHFDLAKNPEKYISENEKNKIITIGMTNLPSHFQMGINHVRSYKYIRLALGLHPLMARNHEKEYSKFLKYIDETSYIGEVGLDFSREGYATREIQIKSFEFVLSSIKGKSKIMSLHSRGAEKETLDLLEENKIKNVIYHWYSGSLSILNKIIDKGFYFSINQEMLKSEKGRDIINKIPKELILIETDFPFINNGNIYSTYEHLSLLWNTTVFETKNIIKENFNTILLKQRH